MILRFSKYACVGRLKRATAYEYWGSEGGFGISKFTPKKFERCKLAEWRGFEPPIRYDPYNGLANRRLQPLGHHSLSELTLEDTTALFEKLNN